MQRGGRATTLGVAGDGSGQIQSLSDVLISYDESRFRVETSRVSSSPQLADEYIILQTETPELVTTERRRRPATAGTDGSWRATVYEHGTRNEATATGRSKNEAILEAFEALPATAPGERPHVTINPSAPRAEHVPNRDEESRAAADTAGNAFDDDDTWLPWRFDGPTRTWLSWAALALITAVAIYPLLLRLESAPTGFDSLEQAREVRFDLAQAGTANSDQCRSVTVRFPPGFEATDLQCFAGGLGSYSGVDLSCEPTASAVAHASWDVCLHVGSWAHKSSDAAPERPFFALVPLKGPRTSARCARAMFAVERNWLICSAEVALVLALLAGIGLSVLSAASRFGWPRVSAWLGMEICVVARAVSRALAMVPYRILMAICYAMVLLAVAYAIGQRESKAVEALCNEQSATPRETPSRR